MNEPVLVIKDGQPVEFLVPCPANTVGVLGFPRPTVIPCGLLEGHEGRHRYAIEWDDQ